MRFLPLVLSALLALAADAKDYPRLTIDAVPSFTNDGVEFVFAGEADYPDGTIIVCGVEFMGEIAQDAWCRGKVSKGRFSATSNMIPSARRVFAGGSNLLGPDDVVDWVVFLQQVSEEGKANAPGPAKRVWSLLDDATRKAIPNALKGSGPEGATLASIIAALNKVLQRSDFHASEDFSNVGLTDEGQRLLDKKGSDRTVWENERLNRLFLEAAWDDSVLRRAPEAPYHAVAVFEWKKQDEDVFPRIVNDPRLKGIREVPKVRSTFAVGTRDQETAENAEIAERLTYFLEPFYRGDASSKDEGFVEEIEEKYAAAKSRKEFYDGGGRWDQAAFQRWLDDFAPRVKQKWLEINAWCDASFCPKYPAYWNLVKQTYLDADMLWRLRVEVLFREHGIECPPDYMAGPPAVPRPKVEAVQDKIRKSIDEVRANPPVVKRGGEGK